MPAALSIVVPSHDTRALTLACLASLSRARAAGGPRDLEVILVDDGSRDGTAEAVAQAHAEVVILRADPSQGFTRAANLGLARATGDVLLLLNSDTEVEPAGPAALAGRFSADPRLGIAGGALFYPDGEAQWSGGAAPTLPWLFALASGLPSWLARVPGYRRLRSPGGAARERREVAWVTGAAMAIRREAWRQVGPLDEGFRFYAQDLDLCLRAGAAGWRVAVLADFPVLHHHGATIQRVDPSAGAAGETDAGHRGWQHAELLWTDLLRWAAKAHGERWAGRAARALSAGASLRLLARRLAVGFLPRARRAGFRAESAALARARDAVRADRRGRRD
jgi:N-acetylglucosaminyl-diphospho-decaprenol L-rhamnosyltransferase